MKSHFLLVEWLLEKKFSIIVRAKIADPKFKDKKDDQVLGKKVMCFWRQKPYLATILKCGDKEDLEKELKLLTSSRDKDEQKKPRNSRELTSVQIDNVLEDLANISEQNHNLETVVEVEMDYKAAYEKSRLRVVKLKNKVKNLRAQLAQRDRDQFCEEETTDLGSGVVIGKTELETVKAISGKPTVFARNLMRRIFDDKELVGKSLFGRKCNANEGAPKPAIDGVKRDAIIAQTVSLFNTGKSDRGMILAIHRTMGDFIRERSNKATPDDISAEIE